MPYAELLRLTVFLCAGEASALGAVGILSASRAFDDKTIYVAAVWWTAAVLIGTWLGRPSVSAEGVREALANAKTATSLPSESENRIALSRLWPIALTTIIAGGIGFIFPSVPVIGAGYAGIVALSWRRREAAVIAIEERDGVRFYVEPTSVWDPVKLIRTPGLGTGAPSPGHPPPPGH